MKLYSKLSMFWTYSSKFLFRKKKQQTKVMSTEGSTNTPSFRKNPTNKQNLLKTLSIHLYTVLQPLLPHHHAPPPPKKKKTNPKKIRATAKETLSWQ